MIGQALMIGVIAFVMAIAAMSLWRSNQQSVTTRHAITAVQPKDAPAAESSDAAMTRYTFWLVIFTGLLAAVGAVQIVVLLNANDTAIRAANAATASNELSRRALVADQRPWLTVEIEPSGPIRWPNGGLEVSYKLTIKNIGKSPALGVTHLESVVLDRNASLATQQKEIQKSVSMVGSTFGAANIMPDDKRQMIFTMQVRPEDVERAAAPWTGEGGPKLVTPVLIGSVEYRTGFDDQPHHTGFIYEIGFWDPAKGITVTALDPEHDGELPMPGVRIRRHPEIDGAVD